MLACGAAHTQRMGLATFPLTLTLLFPPFLAQNECLEGSSVRKIAESMVK
jgi:hypothetical protein